MNTKDKGNIGEVMALAEFVKRGVPVCIPFGDNERYDLVAEFNGKLNKIQAKYCSQITENNSIICPCASSTNHTTNKHYTTYENDVDYISCYIVPWDTIVLIPIAEVGNQLTVCLRKDAPKNNQSNVRLLEDYLFDKIIG